MFTSAHVERTLPQIFAGEESKLPCEINDIKFKHE